MTVTRDEMVRKLSAKSGSAMKDIREVLRCMDEVVFEELCSATPEDEVQIQLVTGIKCGCKIIPARDMLHPKTKEPIFVEETAKPFVKVSKAYKFKLKEAYDNKNG